MATPHRDPSVEFEPHLQPRGTSGDPSLSPLAEPPHHLPAVDLVEHGVWDEPGLSPELAGEPDATQSTYARYVATQIAKTSWLKSWCITLAIVILGGPLGILGALTTSAELGAASGPQWVMMALVAPVTEEITKIAAALWVVEKRPFWFKSMWQILLAALAGGALFGVIENLIYLHIYIPDAPASLARWRWTVCVGLHMTCSFVAGVGLVRIWDNALREQHPPILGLGMPWFVIAMAGHGIYNFGVGLAETLGWLEF